MNVEILVWVAVIIIAIAVETASAQLVSIWFAGGGLAGLVAHFLHAPFWLQVIVAAVVTLILLLATRPAVPAGKGDAHECGPRRRQHRRRDRADRQCARERTGHGSGQRLDGAQLGRRRDTGRRAGPGGAHRGRQAHRDA